MRVCVFGEDDEGGGGEAEYGQREIPTCGTVTRIH